MPERLQRCRVFSPVDKFSVHARIGPTVRASTGLATPRLGTGASSRQQVRGRPLEWHLYGMIQDEAFIHGAFLEYLRHIRYVLGLVRYTAWLLIVCVLAGLWALIAYRIGFGWATLALAAPFWLISWVVEAAGSYVADNLESRFCLRYHHLPQQPSKTWGVGSAPCLHCGALVVFDSYEPIRNTTR